MKSLWQIEFDVDAYLSSGGRLLDILVVPSDDEKDRIAERFNSLEGAKRQTVQRRIERVGRWFGMIGMSGDADDKLREVLTEERARQLWKATAVSWSASLN
jgi:hypothetical protein